MIETYDVIIVGGGIMGCSTALQLARRGVEVALLEKGVIGAGPTGKSSAIIRQHYSNAVILNLKKGHNLRRYVLIVKSLNHE